MAAYDFDWLRVRGFGFFASGDRDPTDDDAEGFDAIFDAPNFAGGEASFWNRQAIKLLGVNLTQRLSPLANLRTSKIEGQSNFVNPGLFLVGTAVDIELTPTVRTEIGGSYMRFHDSDPLEMYLQIENIDEEVGAELFFSAQYRPFLNNHVIFKLGQSTFFPGKGSEKIYNSDRVLYSTFLNVILTW